YIDGDAGILRHRGYPIEDLAEKSTYLETAYLLLNGELPTATQLKDWTYNVTHHTYIHESIKKFLDGFHYDAHPMGMTISTIAALAAGRSIPIRRLQPPSPRSMARSTAPPAKKSCTC